MEKTHQPQCGVLGYIREHTAVAVFWNPQSLPCATFLSSFQDPCLQLPPWAHPMATKLPSFRKPPFFLSLEDPETAADSASLKKKKGTG